jgi:FKBP-type peptidyl-prolyl cis-trans isomerase
MRQAIILFGGLCAMTACMKEAPSPPSPPPPPAAVDPLAAPADLKSPPAAATRTPNGIAFRRLDPGGTAPAPEAQDLVEIHFVGWTSEGKAFDSVVAPSRTQFPLEKAMPAWREALAEMHPGEKRRLWLPAARAQGNDPAGKPLPPGDLVFDLELLNVIKRPKPLPAPEGVAQVARGVGVVKRPSGLVYKSLGKGTGKVHPKRQQMVEINYSGWTPDGRMIESTLINGQPVTMRVDHLGKIWTEALGLMVAGEKARFWMPAAEVGYGGIAKHVVYDVELIAVK